MTKAILTWSSASTAIEDHVREDAQRTLKAYAAKPDLAQEHVGIEDEILSGGYGHRQIHELVQNAADAISEAQATGRVHVVLTAEALYCANEGAPVDTAGVNAILNSHMSRKRGAQIGQFGLGFKSVLAISSCPQFYCKSGSFGFDAQWAATQIRMVLPSVERTPVLRIARVLTPTDADATLVELMAWATTVVKLPRNLENTEWLSRDIEGFPREFLLFSPHVSQLILDDRATGKTRSISILRKGDRVTLREGQTDAEWTVFSREVRTASLGRDALLDADRKTRERDSLPIHWAVPRDGRRSRGKFWAFAPTETETTLAGIINSPWKTNADRQNLLDGPFNRSLLRETVQLVADSLHALRSDDDPGCVLDVLPVRATDAVGWADKALIEELDPALSSRDCIPNSSGALSKPATLGMRPDHGVSPEITELLYVASGCPDPSWVHESVERRERRAKAERLGVGKLPLSAWLESIAQPPSPASSIRALAICGNIEEKLNKFEAETLRSAAIIFTAEGNLVSASHPNLFLPAVGDDRNGIGPVVHYEVAADQSAVAVLRGLRVPEKSSIAQLETALSGVDVDWERVWGQLRVLEIHDALAVIKRHGSRNPIEVRTLSGVFKPISQVLLVGKIVPQSGERDSSVGIDYNFHRLDETLLRELGATDVPVLGKEERGARWFKEYLREMKTEFLAQLPLGKRRPSAEYLAFPRDQKTLGPLDPFRSLSDAGRALMTETLLPHLSTEPPWILRHETTPDVYPSIQMAGPIQWIVKREGLLVTSLGLVPAARSVGTFFSNWTSFLPVANAVEPLAASRLGIPNDWDSLDHTQWAAALDEARNVSDDVLIGQFYGEAAKRIEAPLEIWCTQGTQRVALPPSQVHVATDSEMSTAYTLANLPQVRVEDRATSDALVTQWGLKRSAGTIRFVAAGDETPLSDRAPGLRRYLTQDALSTLVLPCERLWVEALHADLPTAVPLRVARTGGTVCFLATLPELELLKLLAAEFGASLTEDEAQDAFAYASRADRHRLVEAVREHDDVAAKLTLLASAAELISGLPRGLLGALPVASDNLPGNQQAHRRIAEAAIAVHGVEVLRYYSKALADRGLEPPTQWNGTQRALEFVDELGFSEEYAGFQRIRRDPALEVDGPLVLKPLHEFQAKIGARIQKFLLRNPPARGLVSLPTGSGKTRVVVQAVVESIQRKEFDGSVVWIAQSDELCEQAVQSWAQVWRVFGPGCRLRISRLWGGTNNRVVDAEAPHVVVATYQSLVSRLRSPSYGWLRNASCIIIDEAHGSIATSYTEILSALGFTAKTTPKSLIGITATPFRSALDPAETQRLVNRYGGQRFDHDVLPGLDPYPVLQEMGVLARVDHQTLPGAKLTLSDAELAELIQFNKLPRSAELRLGESAPRNKLIIDSIRQLPDEWPVLLFAASVEQAHLMAALLSMEGISSKAISAATEHGARRHYIEEFRHGRIRVLSNYDVLTTGFDAPSVRALYIARPVFSPVVYQQMLGRGLRGPLNGGKDRCLVVNIEDNIAQFGERLAFHDFEYLWKSDA